MYGLLVISPCSSVKRVPPPLGCELGGYKSKPHDQVLNTWLETAQDPRQDQYPAKDLYTGSHWKEMMTCAKVSRNFGFSSELWAVSAGWGLVPSDFQITPYAASFSEGENSIHNLNWPKEFNSKERSRYWWQEINKKRDSDLPQSLPRLYSSFKKKSRLRFLIVLSKEYYLPLESEIIELISLGAEVMIISSGIYSEIETINPLIKDHILPLNMKFKVADEHLKKNCHVLNASFATWLVKSYPDELKTGGEAIYTAMNEKLRLINEQTSSYRAVI